MNTKVPSSRIEPGSRSVEAEITDNERLAAIEDLKRDRVKISEESIRSIVMSARERLSRIAD